MMKKLLFLVASAATLAVSCSKLEQTAALNTQDGSRLVVSVSESPTRAFFDSSAQSETWEKSISSLSVFCFDEEDQLVLRHDFTSDEVSARKAGFYLPKSLAGQYCSFYVVANADASHLKTLSQLKAFSESEAAAYNSDFATVSTQAARSAGFVMSGMKSQTVAQVGSETLLAVTISRTVSKVAIKSSVSDSFKAHYPGKLVITGATLSSGAEKSYVWASGGACSSERSFSHTQASAAVGADWGNLFYIYENGTCALSGAVTVTLRGFYDIDGDISTDYDQSEVEYTLPLGANDSYAIKRNCYYRIAASITGLSGLDCSVTVSVADWTSVFTQEDNLGA